MSNNFSCDICKARDARLHRVAIPENELTSILGGEFIDEDDYSLLCDECYETLTGNVAVCEDFCTLPLDHVGLCRGPYTDALAVLEDDR